MAAKHKNHKFIYYLIAGGGLIFFWRGLWGLLDLYLFPHAPAISYIVSMVIGIILLLVDDGLLKELDHH